MNTTQPTELKILDSDAASLKSVYVDRIERLLRLRREHDQELNSQGIRLLDRAIFAAYCACREVAADDKGREILREANMTLQEPIGRTELDETSRDAGTLTELQPES